MPANRILRQFVSLVSGQFIGSGLGLVFWVVAAREIPTADLGVAAAAINTQTLLGTFSLLGVGTFLLRHLPAVPAREQRAWLRTAIASVGACGLILGLLACVVAPLLSQTLYEALSDPAVAAPFVVGVATYAVSIVVDQAALGVGRAHLQVVRNTVAAGLRFPVVLILVTLGWTDPWVLVVGWVAPMVLSVAVLWRALRLPRVEPRPQDSVRALVRAHWREALRNHGLNLCMGAGPLLVPVIAALTLADTATAEFSVAWMIATFVFVPPYLLAISLFAATASGGLAAFSRSARQTLPAAAGVSFALCVGAWVGAPVVLPILGHQYASGSDELLDLLVLGGLCMVVKDHLVARARVLDQHLRAARVIGLAVILESAGAAIGALRFGAEGLCLGWLAVQAVELVVASPLVVRMLREVASHQTADDPEALVVVPSERSA